MKLTGKLTLALLGLIFTAVLLRADDLPKPRIGIFCLDSAGKETEKGPPCPEPEITDAQRATYFQALAEFQAAKLSADQAQAVLQAALADMLKTCGDRQLVQREDRKPGCKPKADPPKSEPVKPLKGESQ